MAGPDQSAPTVELGEKPTWPSLTSKCRPEELKVIDVAAALVGKPRSHFMLEATLAAARETLAAHNVEIPAAEAAA